MRLDYLPLDSLAKIAWALFDAHGNQAINIANSAIIELETDGMNHAADAWRGVKSMVEDVSLGRIGRMVPTIH